ncbi:ABC transporter permease [Geobacillus icigianus]|uniref:ABC transporter permease n=1 Tax=Geobacillus icigianus TaxID=1430331 RepID=A0ABU6BB49_9BACL|nr:ABC transporter permease subunit [Geobacillus icigianus]MEB3749170.1 hypothetical protein [Geobacillus icigianus]
MIGFWKLIVNESIKIFKRSLFWIMQLVLLISIIIAFIFVNYTKANHNYLDWKKDLIAQNKIDSVKLNNNKIPELLKSQIDEEIKLNNYHLEHNIPPLYENTTFGFIHYTISISSLITLFTIIYASSIVSQEYTWGTLKSLLIRPFHRWELLLSKFLTILIILALFLLSLFVFSFLIGWIGFGFDNGSSHYVYLKGSTICEMSVWKHFLEFYLSKFIDIAIISSFAFMMSTLFKYNALAIGVSLFIELSGSVITNVLRVFNHSFVKYIFFENTNLYKFIEGPPPTTSLSFSIMILLMYFIIFMGVSLLIFEGRDVS